MQTSSLSDKQFKLTRNQVRALCRLDWEEDYEKTLKMIRSWGIDLIEWDLRWFMEIFLFQELIRHDTEKMNREKSEAAKFPKPDKYQIGSKYHLAWAHRGCVWKLKALMPDGRCVLETPKTKKTLIANQADLLQVR